MRTERHFSYNWIQKIEIIQTLVRNLLYKGCIAVNERNEYHDEKHAYVHLTQAERYMYELIRTKDGKTMLQLIKHFVMNPAQVRAIIAAIENDQGISSDDDYPNGHRIML